MSSDIAWIELHDLQTNRLFYINQETGAWSKERPGQVPIVKADPESVWSIWNEETRTTLYYHSKTRRWAHKAPSLYPVVSLSSFAKNSSLQMYLALPNINQRHDFKNGSTATLDEQDHGQDLSPIANNGDELFTASPHTFRNTIAQRLASPNLRKHESLFKSLKKRLTIALPPLSITQPQVNHDPCLPNAPGTSTAQLHRPCTTSPKIQAPRIQTIAPISPPWSPSSATQSSSSSPLSLSFSQIPVSTLSSPLTPLSPFSPSTDNNNMDFSNGKKYIFEEYAVKHFTTHKHGFLRRTPISLVDMSTWTKDSINKPLLRSTNKKYTKDATICFKNIQKVMNDRPRKYHGRTCTCDDVTDIQSILLRGITNGQPFRDEIYVQLCKQLNHNSVLSSAQKGWELFSVLCSTIPPSNHLVVYLHQFIQDHFYTTNTSPSDDDNNSTKSPSMIKSYLCLKMNRICQQGPRGNVPSRAEIQLARMAVLQEQVEKSNGNKMGTTSCLTFGTPLSVIMKHQQQQDLTTLDSEKRLKIPHIVPFLVNAIRQLQGHSTQGVFRVPGLTDLVTSLRIHIENDHDMQAVDLNICCGDPNVPASLLRQWLRELPSCLIPGDYYDRCIDQASDLDAVMEIVDILPDVNRRILLYLIGFIQEFLTPEVCQLTLMSVNNLAMVFAPNFLRGPVMDDLELALQKSKYEQLFVKTLLLGPKINMDLQLYG